MSRQNKVNPGMYTQRGRLSQDDAARELRKTTKAASLTAKAKAGKATTARTRESKRRLAKPP